MHIPQSIQLRLGHALLIGIGLLWVLILPVRAVDQAGAFTPILDTVDDVEVSWIFVDESKPGAPVPSGAPVQSGAAAPAGETAVHFILDSSMEALSIQNQDARLRGLRLAELSHLNYCTYLVAAPMPYAVMLQLNIDLDVSDSDRSWQGRLVYEPARNGAIVQGEWQCWNTLDGAWWATGGPLAAFATPASPQSLAALLAEYPNLGLHPDYGALVLRAGNGWQQFDGYADGLLLGVGSRVWLFDFEGPDDAGEMPVAEVPGQDSQTADNSDKDKPNKHNQDGRDRQNQEQDRNDESRIRKDDARKVQFRDRDDCKDRGWRSLGFRNQGQCVAYANYLANHTDPRR